MITSPIEGTQNNNRIIGEIMEVIIERGMEGIKPVMKMIIDEGMKIERSQFLEAGHYERSEERKGYANGYKPKSIQTRMGKIELAVPQTRESNFYPKSLEKGIRSERALNLAIAEMYIQGVSTRKVMPILKKLCEGEISSTQVSRVSKVLDEGLEKFRNRKLGECPLIYLDARYEKIRHDGVVKDLAVLIGIGVNKQGKREILGVSISLSEAEVHWRNFLKNLQERGLRGMRLIVSDGHTGLKAARKSVFPAVPWQRCYFHISQNAIHYAPKTSMRDEISEAVKDIFNAPSIDDARRKLKETISKYQDKASNFAKWLEENAEEGFTFYSFPRSYWKKIRSSNISERLNREIKRRTRVVGIFPNSSSCLRLITAMLQEKHEDWIAGSCFLNIDTLNK